MTSVVPIDALIASYPRQRPALTPAHERIFAEQYRINRDGAGTVERAAQWLERWMHLRVAGLNGGPVLELGAGTLNHRTYEPLELVYDVVEPFRELYRGRTQVKHVRSFFDQVDDVPIGERYRRVISIAVLEHMTNLPADVANAALRLHPRGTFQAGIPSEGGLLWWLGWRLSTGISYRIRTGLDYGTVMRHEHVNGAREIIAIIRHLFRSVTLQRFPFPWHQMSFYTYVEAREPRYDRCQQLLERKNND